nr:TetR/AcrR family transcriptional regulator [Leifsonia xyli]
MRGWRRVCRRRRRWDVLRCARHVGRIEPVLGFGGDVAAPVFGQCEGDIEDEGALGVLAGSDAVQDLDSDASLEQVVEDDEAFEEVAAEAVDLLDGEYVAGRTCSTLGNITDQRAPPIDTFVYRLPLMAIPMFPKAGKGQLEENLHSTVQYDYDSAMPNPTRTPRRDATANREAILVAAAAAFTEDIDASLETIAARAGLSRRAIYGHFATRDELLTAVFTRGAARLAALLGPVSHPDARVEIALYGATLWAGVEHIRVSAALAVRGPHRAEVVTALDPARERLRTTVQRGMAAGAIRADLDRETVTRLIENAAVSVLDEATRTGLSDADGHRLVMLAGLSAAGMGWQEAGTLIDGTPELAFEAVQAEGASIR